jgi:hypothetical protein
MWKPPQKQNGPSNLPGPFELAVDVYFKTRSAQTPAAVHTHAHGHGRESDRNQHIG